MRELTDEAVVRLERAGVSEDLRGWMSGRALPARGAQRRWARAVRTALRQLLIDNGGADNDVVKAFFEMHSEVQAAATALVLACSQSVQDAQESNIPYKSYSSSC